MPIYELRENAIHPATVTSFEAEGIKERQDIQRLLRERIDSLGEGLMVLAEEFSGWVDSTRRIDLLCLDASANLVVVELKRNDDGSHMELQALRYAAMVARMTFEQAVDTLARQRNVANPDHDAARADILAFLKWDEPYENGFATNTRVILAAADFGKELTTCVLWLRGKGVDIRCVRLQPYRLDGQRLLVDIQQLIPTPEESEFQTQIGAKRAAETKNQAERAELRFKFWEALLSKARTRTQLHANRKPGEYGWIGGGIGRSGFGLNYVTRQKHSVVELWIADDMAAFHALKAQQSAIEAEFGQALDWQDLPDSDGARVCLRIDGGYRSAVEDWATIHDKMIDAMIKLDLVFRKRVAAL